MDPNPCLLNEASARKICNKKKTSQSKKIKKVSLLI